MKTIQMTIDEPLLELVDSTAKEMGATRSSFIREALYLALAKHRIEQLEKMHVAGYVQQPVKPGEFDVWESEQFWGNE
ncbi:MAG: ribbon-helix-helix protein, CopG family [Caldilineales bacterium]|nr:ribbon-helix-helix protein, CopG family [Caldilineales bacterium]